MSDVKVIVATSYELYRGRIDARIADSGDVRVRFVYVDESGSDVCFLGADQVLAMITMQRFTNEDSIPATATTVTTK